MNDIRIIVLFLFASVGFCFQSQAGLIRVGTNEKSKTIQNAISIANDGDTILVRSGIYKEGNILIRKSLTLIGEGKPVLDGENQFEILTINARNVTVAGFSFRNTGVASINDPAGIKILDSHHVRIRGNDFTNAFFGIHFSNSSHSIVEDNTLLSTGTVEQRVGNGIHMWKCHHMEVKNNKIKGHRDGIYFEFVTNSKIMGNVSEGNLRYGLHFMFSHDDEYTNNKFINNGAGVAVMYTKGVRMIDNTFEKNWGSAAYGLLLKDIRDSHVQGNRFVENSVAIFMEGSSRIKFFENDFRGNGYGIRLQASCDDNVFQRNNFIRNTFDLATNGSLVLNKISGNYWDRYEGYDLNKDKIGDVPYHPVSMYSMVVERVPTAILLWRSFLVFLLDRAEKAIPAVTPENLVDDKPQMNSYDFNK